MALQQIKFHNDIFLPSAYSEDGPEGRKYKTPDGNDYFSITTILGEYGEKKFLEDWKIRIGEAEALRITKQASLRGNGMHSMIESYLQGQPLAKSQAGYLNFLSVKKHLDNISEIYFQEAALFSDEFQTAGRTDLLGVYKGIGSVVDFKTSRKQKKLDWIQKYFIQGAFYSRAFKERTFGKFDLEQVVILISNDDGSSDEFIVKTKDYHDEMIEAIDYFKEYRKIYEN